MTPLLERAKILVVDDNPENIWSLIELLEQDYDLLTATNGEKALELVYSDDRPDLILLDIVMPDMDGYQVYSRLKEDEASKDIPVIFLTSKSEEWEETKGLELGANDYISKPFSLEVARARIKSVLNLNKELERRKLLKNQLEQLNMQLEGQIRQNMDKLLEAKETLNVGDKEYKSLVSNKPFDENPKIILVVDDNPENIHVLIETLEAEYTVIYATNGQKALDIANSKDKPDLILLDIMMPGMDGYEVCSRLKDNADTRDIPVIFITALNQEKEETRGLQLGAVDFVSKPFSIPVVEVRIKTALHIKEEMEKRMLLAHKLEHLNKTLEVRIQDRTSDLKQAHEHLKVSEQNYRTIFENAIEGIFQSTPQGRYIKANGALAKILGYQSPQEVLSTVTNISQQVFLHPADRNEFIRIVEQKGEIFNFETQFKKKNGEVIWVMLSAKAVYDGRKRLIYCQGFCLDITARKKAEDEIQRNYDIQTAINAMLSLSLTDLPLDEIIEKTLDIIWDIKWFSFHSWGSIFLVEGTPDLLVLKAQRGMPKKLRNLCKTVPFGHCLCGKAAQSREIQFASHIDNRHDTTVDAMQPHGHYCVPILMEEKLLGVINFYLQDGHQQDKKEIEYLKSIAYTLATIIERRRVAKEREQMVLQLRQAQKMEAIGSLAGGIAHDFNNILTAALGYNELAMRKIPADHPITQDLIEVQKAGLRAKELVKQILTFSRKSASERRPLELHSIVKETLKLLRASIPTTIEIAEKISAQTCTVLADPTQIHQIVMNLCTNAYQAMRKTGGTLAVELHEITIDQKDSKVAALDLAPGPFVVLKVNDTGHGMDRATKERVFDPYFTTKDKEEGTGMGLAVVHGIVKSYGGHITIYSEPGKGTSIQVYLPQVVTEVKNINNSLEDIIQKGNEHILVVDDVKEVLEAEKLLLENLGYKVTGIGDCQEALQLFQTKSDFFDLIITDMTMPHMTGAEFSRKILKIRPNIPIIMCTGFSELITEEIAKSMGIREYIMKPITQKEIANVVRKVLDETVERIE